MNLFNGQILSNNNENNLINLILIFLIFPSQKMQKLFETWPSIRRYSAFC